MSPMCPDCKSENTQNLSIVYGAGTSKIRMGILGLSDNFLEGARSTGTSASLLAKQYAPPKREKLPIWFWVLLIGGIIVACVVYGDTNSQGWFLEILGGTILLTAAIGFRVFTRNKTVYPQKLAEWGKKFLCMRCGKVFEPS